MTTATAPNRNNSGSTEKSNDTCNLHIALSEAGRVGKSTMIKCLAEYLTYTSREYKIADTDRQNPDVAQAYTPELWQLWQQAESGDDDNSFAPQAPTNGASNTLESLQKEQIYFSDDTRMAYLPRRLMQLSRLTANLLINVPANSYQEVTSFLKANAIGTTKSRLQLFNWWVSDGSHKSLDLFLETKLMLPEANHIVVLNQGRSNLIKDPKKYRWPSSLYEKYQDPKYAASDIKTVLIPELAIDLQTWYSKDTKSHSNILADQSLDELDLMAVKIWQSSIFDSINKTKLIT